MIFKIELASAPDCAGFAIVLPVPVWDSWLKHLGRPELAKSKIDEMTYTLVAPAVAPTASDPCARAMVYVFDTDEQSTESPLPLKIIQRVEVSADALAHHAFVRASNEAIERGVVTRFRQSFIKRIGKGWNNKLPKLK